MLSSRSIGAIPDEAAPQRQLLPLTAEDPEKTEPPLAVPPRPQGEQDLE